jgi:Carboxypeptidase regulatory-like domain/TonB dependent receptor
MIKDLRPHLNPPAICGFVAVTILSLFCNRTATAQVLFGSIVGNVTDASGAGVPGATVEITETSTNETRTVQTNEGGVYTITTVTAGTYQMGITKVGFRRFVASRILLNQNNVVRVDAKLELGAQSERVEVTTDAAALETDRADVHAEISTQQLENLPQATRAYAGLVQLVPGAALAAGQLQGGTNNPSKGLQFAFNGTTTSGAQVRIEGISATNLWQQYQTTFQPSVEAIQNVNIATNATDAEQGLAGGASVNVMLKSGANQTHGTAYAYNTDSYFQANNFFSNASGIPKAAHLVDNNDGGFVGGHVIRNKLFYFGSYEGDYLRQANSGLLSFPAPTQLAGNFSASANPIYDPSTGNANGTGRTPFPGNIIPSSRINPVMSKIIALIPPTNLPGSINNIYVNEPTFYNLHKIDTKFDYTPKDKLHISGRFGYQPYNASFAPVYGPILGGSHPFTACGACNYLQHGATLAVSGSVTYIVSPTFVVDGTFGVTWAKQFLLPTQSDTKYALDVLGIPGTNQGNLPWAGGLPQFQMSNFTTMGGSYPPLEYTDPIFEYLANATKTQGNHTIRFGMDISRQHINHIEVNNTVFTFTGSATTLNGGPGANQYNQVADFILGLPASETGSTQIEQPFYTLRTWNFAVYARDQWQVNRKLTVNYGLRWEKYPLPVQTSKGINNYSPTTNTVQQCGVGGTPEDCGISDSNLLFAPSIGIAYRLTDTLVARTGFSLSPQQNNAVAQSGVFSFPDQLNASFSGPNSYTPVGSISNGIPILTVPPITNGQLTPPAGTGNLFVEPKNFVRGYVESYNVALQKEFKGGWTAQAGWVGTHLVHGITMYNLNYGQVGGGTASEPQAKYGITGTVTFVGPIGSDVYQSLQVRLAKHFSNGFQSQIAYTYSHDIGYTPSILIPQYRNYNYYTTALDRPNAFVWSASYELPFGRGKKYLQSGIAAQIAGGWTINGLFTHYSGIPFSITSSSASCNCPGNTQTANQILPNVSYVGSGLNGQPYFNPLAFAPVTSVGFGNAGFNTLRGPDSTNLDLNLFRDFRVTERITIQIRADSFNISNTPHFSNPASNVSNLQLNPDGSVKNLNGYDTITSVNPLGRLIDPRYFRFGLRVSF